MRVLDLSGNTFGDLGINQFISKLKNPQTKLETLCLNDCDITDKGCAVLASALNSNLSHLTMLSLFDEKLSDSGVKPLLDAQKKPGCELKTLRLHCDLTVEELCAVLSIKKLHSKSLKADSIVGKFEYEM